MSGGRKDDHVPITVAAVEGGGTTFCIAIAQLHAEGAKITHRISIDSCHEDPQRTLFECATFLEGSKPPGGYHALGLATFGPVGLNTSEKNYGSILPSSPKKAWRNVNLLKPLVKACQGKARKLAVKVETDVNAPAWAEYELLNKEGIRISSLAYVTVGTGVGVGLIVNDLPVHGRMHPEGGHVPVHPLEGDDFPGYSWGITHSPFGGKRTVEGIASSVALTERLHCYHGRGRNTNGDRSILSELDDDDGIWNHAANAIANLCVTLLLTVSIERIILGGGVLNRNGLMEKVRKQTVKLMNGYVELPDDMSELIHSSAWGDEAGLIGAVVLAQKAYQEEQQHDVKGATFVTKSSRFGYLNGVLTGALLTAAITMVVVARRGRATRSQKVKGTTMLDDKNSPPKPVMQEHDPNDDPFADLTPAVETKQLVSPLEFGSGAVSPTKDVPANNDAATRHENEEKNNDAARQDAAPQEDVLEDKAVAPQKTGN